MNNFLKFKKSQRYLLAATIIIAVILRLYGVNWDQNQHLHPDERFLTMVTQAVHWPSSLGQHLNPVYSPLNPYNVGFGFFVYGTFPMYIVKFFSGFLFLDKFDYNNITLVGRLISALFDLGTVYFVYKIAEKIFNKKTGLLACFLYAISVLPIQLSHFFAVDTFLVFFLTASFYNLLKFIEPIKKGVSGKFISASFIGILFGLAVASKISAILFAPIILLGFLYLSFKNRNIPFIIGYLSLVILLSYFSFRFSDPRVFSGGNLLNLALNPQFVQNLQQLKSFDNPDALFPPAVQWLTTKKIIFPLKNMVLWGLGLPLGILVFSSIFYSLLLLIKLVRGLILKYHLKSINYLTLPQFGHSIILVWTLLLFFYQGVQFSKAMRYLFPIYPFFAVLSANLLHILTIKAKKVLNPKAYTLSLVTCSILLFAWPFSFISIYSRPHSRVTASEWIYKNIPAGSILSCEHWDDCLPLSIYGKSSQQFYVTETLELYNPDTQVKWNKLNYQLQNIDYIILSSNRLWGSIPKVPGKYPMTSKFYEDLLSEQLHFTKVAEIYSYPTIPLFNVQIPDDAADESFTVYDHPKVLIYQKR